MTESAIGGNAPAVWGEFNHGSAACMPVVGAAGGGLGGLMAFDWAGLGGPAAAVGAVLVATVVRRARVAQAKREAVEFNTRIASNSRVQLADGTTATIRGRAYISGDFRQWWWFWGGLDTMVMCDEFGAIPVCAVLGIAKIDPVLHGKKKKRCINRKK